MGASITLPDDLETDTQVDGFASLGATRTTPSAHGVDQYAVAAYSLAHQALADENSRDAFVGCVPAFPGDEVCARDFIVRFGRKAFRRPLTDDEVARFGSLYAAAAPVTGDFHASLEYVVAAMLQSPSFLYRAEIGQPDPIDPSRRLLDPFELASRLSYFLWSSTPDDELLEAAASGDLATDEGLAGQSRRLLASPRAIVAERQFFTEVFQLAQLDGLPQLEAYFPQMSSTFGASARDEMLALVDDIVSGRDADYGELFDTRRGFVNAEMGALYGVDAPSNTAAITLPEERAGMFSRGAFLALNGHASSTSPTKRGKFVREVVLCQVVAPPPPNANVALRPAPPSPVPRTLREQLALHTTNPACATCHTALDPIGLGVEEFDGIGALRAVEAGRPIDNAGVLNGTSFAGAAALGALVKADPSLGPCLVRDMFRYAIGHLEDRGEAPVLDALSKNFAAGGRHVRGLVETSVASASFRYTGEPE
jgi:Protein of unknown function (DUF1592)/Protein of unknown function (DUF1588)/Protein of unknown function (DUF1595)/Protein of unknown function (DUF1585)